MSLTIISSVGSSIRLARTAFRACPVQVGTGSFQVRRVKGRPLPFKKYAHLLFQRLLMDIVRPIACAEFTHPARLNGATRLSIVGWRDLQEDAPIRRLPVVYQLRFLLGLFWSSALCPGLRSGQPIARRFGPGARDRPKHTTETKVDGYGLRTPPSRGAVSWHGKLQG